MNEVGLFTNLEVLEIMTEKDSVSLAHIPPLRAILETTLTSTSLLTTLRELVLPAWFDWSANDDKTKQFPPNLRGMRNLQCVKVDHPRDLHGRPQYNQPEFAAKILQYVQNCMSLLVRNLLLSNLLHPLSLYLTSFRFASSHSQPPSIGIDIEFPTRASVSAAEYHWRSWSGFYWSEIPSQLLECSLDPFAAIMAGVRGIGFFFFCFFPR
jgi:hypothetical protein